MESWNPKQSKEAEKTETGETNEKIVNGRFKPKYITNYNNYQ